MAGTLPKTKLLLTRHGCVAGEFSSYMSVVRYVGVEVTDDGDVLVQGKASGPGYIMKEDKWISPDNVWKSKLDVLKDWCRYHFRLPPGYTVYRFLV